MSEFPIVGIGASAGGLKAAEAFLKNAPADSGMAFVLVFHLDPKHKSEAAELLQRHTKMPVAQIEGRTSVRPNHVYVIPPNHGLTLADGALVLSERVRADGRPTVIDRFFRSLAAEAGERAIGVILSGTGTEGSQGLKAIKEAGGVSMVQDEAEAEYGGMPHSAIATGLIDFVLPVAEMGKRLLEIKDSAVHFALPEAEKARENDAETLQKIFVQLRTQTGHDFGYYKQSTVLRRITRRVQVRQLESLEAYLEALRSDPAETAALYRELLISVTNFFRDSEAFAALEEKVIPKLCGKREQGATVRVWAPGCATGEEAYSLAMLMCEACDGLASPPKLQIFATDVDERALEAGRRGLYPDAIAGDISDARLKRFFTRKGSAFEVAEELREMILFAKHDLLKDPPFSKLDLISCRNLLIYLNGEVQTRVFELFHFALKSQGILFLGSSESLGEARKLFSELDRKAKIFQEKRVPGAEVHFPLISGAGSAAPRLQAGGEKAAASFQDLARRQLLAHYAPPCVIVDENYDVVYISGRVGKYLEPSAGAPNQNILAMAREGLGLELRTALYRAQHGGEGTDTRRVRVQTNGDAQLIGLTVQPLTEAEGHLLVIFEDLEPGEAPEPPREGESGMVVQLERELKSTQESLQTSIEELETSNEELRASNAELMSVNEELQSTSEELETGKEELQSANEELLAVNQELQSKNDELARANSDLNNFIASTEIGTLFLDEALRVRRYTPSLAELFNLIATDVGRPLAHLTHNLEDDLVADAERVLRELTVVEKEISSKDGHVYLTRLRPYRTVDSKVGGVTLTFVDISERYRLEQQTKVLNTQVETQKAYAESIVDTVREPLLVLAGDLRVVSASRAFYRIFETTSQPTEHTPLYELGDKHWDIPELRRLLEEILPQHTTVEDFEVRHDFGHGERILLLNARRLCQEEGLEPLILVAVEDVTERTLAPDALRRLASIVDTSDDAIISKDLEGVITTWNKSAEEMFGYSAEEAIGQPITALIIPKSRDGEEKDILRRIAQGLSIDHFETVRRRKDGSTLDVSVTISPLQENGRVIGASKIARDVSEQNRTEAHRRLLLNELNHRVKNTLSTVQSIAMQTFGGSQADAELVWRFESRLMALAKAHGLLTRSHWRSVNLHELMTQELAPFTGDDRKRLAIGGEDVELRPKTALALGMAFHELATNAVKYGALSRPSGRVRIVTKVNNGKETWLRIRWTETGGPEVRKPQRRGFGTRLVSSGLTHELGSKVRMNFRPEGLVCTIEVPPPKEDDHHDETL